MSFPSQVNPWSQLSVTLALVLRRIIRITSCRILVDDEAKNQRSADFDNLWGSSVAVGRRGIDALLIRPGNAVVGGDDAVDAESPGAFGGLEHCH